MVRAWALVVVACACHSADDAAPSPPEHDLAALHRFEEHRRAATSFAALPPSEEVLGPDPYRIEPLGHGLIGILRGESAVVSLDAHGIELWRAATPRSPVGLAVSAEGDVLVAGEGARDLAHYRGERLERLGTVTVDALGMRAVAFAPDGKTAYVVEEREGRLLAVSLARDGHALRAVATHELGRCHGPIQVAAVTGYVVVDCLLDHTLEVYRVSGVGDAVTRIRHDGPIWSFALEREADGGLLVAAGGVEDHALEREDGGFGYIDSFVYLYRLAPGAPAATRLAAINTSALGVVTPKWLALRGTTVTTAGYASASLVTLAWRDFASEPTVTRAEWLPGTTAAVLADDGSIVAANPLFDAWVTDPSKVTPIAGPRPVTSRLGELLFFTTMMAPWNSSEGKLSRFTCETCHYEGYVDGRTHYTGRDDVHATTKPLYGLFNNRPYFSRALDKTMTEMVHAEFRVANRHNGRDPWFSLTHADVPWLDQVAGAPGVLTPELLRESLMTFLMDFTHRANPAALGHARYTDAERDGAYVFRDHCASCHAARLVGDDPRSLVPFERWEALVLSPAGPLVWSNAAYAKTGVLPYVHAEGARVPSLRRLYKKWPYFTNGSAKSLAELLDRFATDTHDGAPATAARLTADDKSALLAFLGLL